MTFSKVAFVLFTEIIRVIISSGFATSFLEKKNKRIRIISSYIFAVVITTLVYLVFNNPVFNLISTLLGLIIIAIAYDGTLKNKILFPLYVLALGCLIDLVVYASLNRILDYNNYSAYASILSLLLLLAAELITRRFLRKNEKAELSNRHWMLYIASLSVCIITSLIIFIDRTISPFSLSIVCGAFLLVNINIAYLIDDLVNSSKDALENQVLSDQMKAYEREIKLQNERVENLRSFKHDMKRHVYEMAALAETGDTRLIKKYVSELDDYLNEAGVIVDSGNTGLDTVLNYMLQRAIDKNIQVNCRVVVPRELELSNYDMNIILGNLIENAIEALDSVPNPRIDLVISFLKDSLIIELSNTNSHKVKFKDGLPVTTKKPASEHGYGIRNVKRILDKYTSTIDFDCSESRFTVRILIKIL